MRTLLFLGGEILHVTEDELKVGEVIKIEGIEMPLVVREMNDSTSIASYDADGKETTTRIHADIDKVAYLHYDEKMARKFGSYKKKTSQKLERSLAINLKGTTTPGSGAFSFNKGDVKSELWLAEHKFTDKISYRFSIKTWQKIAQEAFESNKKPLMEVVLHQSQAPIKFIATNILDFVETTNSTEEEFSALFFCTVLKPKPNKDSILLESSAMREYNDEVRGAGRIPAILLEFGKLTLLILETQDFVRIYAS